MNTQPDATENENQNASGQGPRAMLGAGNLAAALRRSKDGRGGWRYRFNIFRMSKASGRVSQRFLPRDVEDLARLAQLLAFVLSEDEGLPQELRDDLGCLYACLDQVFEYSPRRAPLLLKAGDPAADALRDVLDYLIEDESRRFAEAPSDDHVYRRLLVLDQWLAGCGPRGGTRLAQIHLGEVADHFGVCPICGRNDGFLNVGRAHWFVCHAHHVRWCVGENLFSCWRRQTPAARQLTWERIRDYREVIPIMPAPLDTEADQ